MKPTAVFISIGRGEEADMTAIEIVDLPIKHGDFPWGW
jgi:hypothetical protein